MTLRSTKWVFWILTASLWLPVGFLLPVLVLTQIERGMTLAEVGIVFATYSLTTAVLELPTGGLADSFGRKPVLVVAALLTGVMAITWFASDVTWVFVPAAFVGGVGRALSSGPLEAWFVDTTHGIDPEGAIRPGLAGGEVAGGLSIAVGSLAVTAMTFIPWISANGGPLSADRLPALFAAVAACVNAVAIIILMREERPTDRSLGRAFADVPGVVRRALVISRRPGAVRYLLMAGVLMGMAFVSVEVFYQPFFREMLASATDAARLFGILTFSMALASALGSVVAGLVPSGGAFRPGRVGAVSLVAVAAAMLGFSFSGSVLVGGFFFVAIYGLSGFAYPFSQQILHDDVEAAERSTMVSAWSLSSQAGSLVTTLGLAQVALVVGIPRTLWIAVGALLAASLLYVSIDRLDRRSETKQARASITG